ncbi:DUF4135 domain-containing protein [Acanthopleuribacter pedis]|uniref:DUF4135 domain-containing protein n=1 Tax=Acanthopleuribacter pedis TaxID=442870 RepID=A0A8J7QDQ1_9BACT|nr:DUF4135 domain-containing protein [Acanthopleuribacter pedis]MBO1321904.1 DUF4135 domain-containing protein [Acanthopleuribacter pedis]
MTFPSLRQFSQIARTRHTGTLNLDQNDRLRLQPSGTLGKHSLTPQPAPDTDSPLFRALEEAVAQAGFDKPALAALGLPPQGQNFSPRWLREQLGRLDSHTSEMIRAAAQPGADPTLRTNAVNLLIDTRLHLPNNKGADLMRAELSRGIDAVMDAVVALDRTPDLKVLTQVAQSLADTLFATTAFAFEALTKQESPKLIPNAQVDALVAELQAEHKPAGALAAIVKTNLDSDMKIQTTNFGQNINTLMENLQRDLPDLNARFFPGDGNRASGLTGFKLTDSDPHKKGQRVAILSFDNQQKIVFKPRDARIDEAVVGRNLADGSRSALEMLEDARPTQPNQRPLPGMLFLHRNSGGEDAYSYQTHLSNQTAPDHLMRNPSEAKAYFREMGSLAFLASIAGVSDLHHENLMTSARQPFLTDLEIAASSGVIERLAQQLSGGNENILGPTMMRMVLESKNQRPNPPGPYKITEEGLAQDLTKTVSVLESFVAVQDGDTLRDNRTTFDDQASAGYNPKTGTKKLAKTQGGQAQAPDQKFTSRYGADFARGFREAAAAFPKEGVAFLHNRLSGFKLRMHPIKTGDHGYIVRSYRKAIDLPEAQRLAKVKAQYVEKLSNLQEQMGTRQMQKPLDAATIDLLADRFTEQVKHFDIAYNSHVPAQDRLVFDKSADPIEGFFKPATLHTDMLLESLTYFQSNAHSADKIEADFARAVAELSEQKPARDEAYTKLRAETEALARQTRAQQHPPQARPRPARDQPPQAGDRQRQTRAQPPQPQEDPARGQVGVL